MTIIKIFFRLSVLVMLLGSLACVAIGDEASIKKEAQESYLTGEVESITREALDQMGLSINVSPGDDSLSVVEITASDSLTNTIKNGQVDIYFSVFDKDDQLVLLMPRYDGKRNKYTVSDKHLLRMTIASKAGSYMMRPGVIYSFDTSLR